MVSNFAFTLYEIFGYLMPGSLALAGFAVVYWALFVPDIPLGVSAFAPDIATWALVIAGGYVLGHAVQAIGNLILRQVERKAIEMANAPLLRKSALDSASKIFGVEPKDIEPRWAFRILDEYTVQKGQSGDRDMFLYREGFYRGTCIALFFLAASLILRSAISGASIQFWHWRMSVSVTELVTTALLIGGLGWLFLRRYRRFAEYRVTRAILSALVLQQLPKDGNETKMPLTEK
jgi:hypothetical protein